MLGFIESEINGDEIIYDASSCELNEYKIKNQFILNPSFD
jgi:hypothetical protein